MKPITQKQIADRLGVSRPAVAFALSDKAQAHKQLRPDTRRRILETARQMNYVPHAAARRLTMARADNPDRCFGQVGILVLIGPKETFDPTLMAMTTGAESELSDLDASLTFVRASRDEDWLKVDRMARSGSIDSWLLYGAVNDQVIQRPAIRTLPHVVIGDHACTEPIAAVSFDFLAIGPLVVAHLAAMGHRRIAYWGSKLRMFYQHRTFEGFAKAVRRFGLADDPALVVSSSNPRAEQIVTPAQVADWLERSRPTAIFTPEFEAAREIHRYMDVAGLSIPRDISVIASEMPTLTVTYQGWTRIELDVIDIGRHGARLLHQSASNRSTHPRRIEIAPTLVEGWSTGPPAQT